jgi:hypothetical protein
VITGSYYIPIGILKRKKILFLYFLIYDQLNSVYCVE